MHGLTEPTIPFGDRSRTRMVLGMREAEARQRGAIGASSVEADGPATPVSLA